MAVTPNHDKVRKAVSQFKALLNNVKALLKHYRQSSKDRQNQNQHQYYDWRDHQDILKHIKGSENTLAVGRG